MTNRWDDLVALARQIHQAHSSGAAIDPEKAKKLACAVLAFEEEPRPARDGEAAPRRSSSAR